MFMYVCVQAEQISLPISEEVNTNEAMYAR